MNAAPIPVVVLTGFLGSGKTTLLNRLLAPPGMADTLVIINEYGPASLDHLLVTHTTEQPVVELAGGCVCCTLRGDLAQTLRDAHWRFARAGRRQFARVVIETTGLADPAPVLRTLAADERIAARYRLACTLTTVDAGAAAHTLANHPEALRQIACADRLLISKTDLVAADVVATLRAALSRINPFAPQIDLHAADVDAGLLSPAIAPTVRYRPASGIATGVAALVPHDVRADSFTVDTPIPPARLEAWLAAWPAVAGPGLLRMKALLDVAGLAAPLAVHGVQHTLHPPIALPVRPDGAGGSSVVCITQGIEFEALRSYMAKLGAD